MFFEKKYNNGIVLIAEKKPHLESCAFSILLPSGSVDEDDSRLGLSSVVVDMLNKGCGEYTSKEFVSECEKIGLHIGSSSGVEVSAFSGVVLKENLNRALELYSKYLLKPQFPQDSLASVKSLLLQELDSIEDEPSTKVMIELSKNFYNSPFNRGTHGTKEGISNVEISDVKNFYKQTYLPTGTIIAVSGNFDEKSLCDFVEKYFGEWSGSKAELATHKEEYQFKNIHLPLDSAQVQIAFACPSISYSSNDYYKAKLAVGLLSGGMFGRLFVEVREKRGLVYRVSASHTALKNRSAVFAYAGTTPENAQNTFEVMLEEFSKLKSGISKEELERTKADYKSRLVISRESASSYASSLSNDWFNIGRIRTIDEILDGINKVSEEDIHSFIDSYPIKPQCVISLGKVGLKI